MPSPQHADQTVSHAIAQPRLAIEARTGVNPYKFGVIGSTDSHTALATGDEDNFFGKFSANEPNASRASAPQTLGIQKAERSLSASAGIAYCVHGRMMVSIQ